MFTKETLIPIAGIAIFIFAIVGLVWGEQLGWVDWARSVPGLGIFLIGAVILAGAWRFFPRVERWNTILRLLLVAAAIGLMIWSLLQILGG